MLEKFNDLKWRLIIHSFNAFLVTLIVYLSVYSISKFFILALIIALIIAANMEFLHFCNLKKIYYNIWPSVPFIIIWPCSVFLGLYSKHWMPITLIVSFLSLILIIFSCFKEVENSIAAVSAQIFSHVYITIPISLFIPLIYLDLIGLATDGRIWLAYLICVSKGADVGGYFFGSLFGKKPLAPSISPKKTLEGFYGGVACSIFVSLLFYMLGLFCPKGVFYLGLMESIILGISVSLVSQFGDLSESLFKRDAKIKDSSKIPAVGGVLDIVDSLLLTTPILLSYLMLSR